MVNPDFEIRPSILVGDSSDIVLQRTQTILRNEGVNPTVSMEFSAERAGVFCGIREVRVLLTKVLPETGSEVWALEEGEELAQGEVALRIRAPYGAFGLYETTICGILSSSSGWSQAARECVEAAQRVPVLALASRHIHPNVAAIIDYSAIRGGCVSCSTVLGARLSGVTPAGNMPHALPLLLGDTTAAVRAFDRHMPPEVPRIAVVDTFRDEGEEAISVADTLREKLRGVLLDTPKERGGVSPSLVKEVRVRLDLAGFRHVEIFVSGGFTPERIRDFMESETPVNGFGVGHYIASGPPNAFTADIHEIDGEPIAKRGRIPGITTNPRLDRVM
jgi:nicotinate phosphoribosyltransferase